MSSGEWIGYGSIFFFVMWVIFEIRTANKVEAAKKEERIRMEIEEYEKSITTKSLEDRVEFSNRVLSDDEALKIVRSRKPTDS